MSSAAHPSCEERPRLYGHSQRNGPKKPIIHDLRREHLRIRTRSLSTTAHSQRNEPNRTLNAHHIRLTPDLPNADCIHQHISLPSPRGPRSRVPNRKRLYFLPVGAPCYIGENAPPTPTELDSGCLERVVEGSEKDSRRRYSTRMG